MRAHDQRTHNELTGCQFNQCCIRPQALHRLAAGLCGACRDIDSFLTQDQLFTALDLLRAPGIHVDEGLDPAAAGLLGLPGGLGALVSELGAWDALAGGMRLCLW